MVKNLNDGALPPLPEGIASENADDEFRYGLMGMLPPALRFGQRYQDIAGVGPSHRWIDERWRQGVPGQLETTPPVPAVPPVSSPAPDSDPKQRELFEAMSRSNGMFGRLGSDALAKMDDPTYDVASAREREVLEAMSRSGGMFGGLGSQALAKMDNPAPDSDPKQRELLEAMSRSNGMFGRLGSQMLSKMDALTPPEAELAPRPDQRDVNPIGKPPELQMRSPMPKDFKPIDPQDELVYPIGKPPELEMRSPMPKDFQPIDPQDELVYPIGKPPEIQARSATPADLFRDQPPAGALGLAAEFAGDNNGLFGGVVSPARLLSDSKLPESFFKETERAEKYLEGAVQRVKKQRGGVVGLFLGSIGSGLFG